MPRDDELEEEGLRVVLDRFPAHAAQIRQLYPSDENFRAMSDDLAEAARALRGVALISGPVRAVRRAEYETLVKELLGEIEGTLRRIKITPLGRVRGR